ncbi:P3a protein [Red clover enamovirus 1]|nr:P3a protein [Red clover enamovirus 1]QJQ82537.1 P3a protein [Red clover enamovirus 1]
MVSVRNDVKLTCRWRAEYKYVGIVLGAHLIPSENLIRKIQYPFRA